MTHSGDGREMGATQSGGVTGVAELLCWPSVQCYVLRC